MRTIASPPNPLTTGARAQSWQEPGSGPVTGCGQGLGLAGDAPLWAACQSLPLTRTEACPFPSVTASARVSANELEAVPGSWRTEGSLFPVDMQKADPALCSWGLNTPVRQKTRPVFPVKACASQTQCRPSCLRGIGGVQHWHLRLTGGAQTPGQHPRKGARGALGMGSISPGMRKPSPASSVGFPRL